MTPTKRNVGKGIELVISRKFLLFNIALLLIVVPVISYTIDTEKIWHPLQLISTEETGSTSVDEDANGAIDNAERCGNGICETKQVRITGGTPAAGAFLISDADGLGSWQTTTAGSGQLPAGTIMYFNLAACPPGWADSPSEQGRYIVGLDSAQPASAGQTVGTALTNLENRPISKHTHEIGGISHTHTIPIFTHQNSVRTYNTATFASNNIREAHWVAAFKTKNAVVKTDTSSPSITETSTTGTGSSTNAPYIQLKACRKSP